MFDPWMDAWEVAERIMANNSNNNNVLSSSATNAVVDVDVVDAVVDADYFGDNTHNDRMSRGGPRRGIASDVDIVLAEFTAYLKNHGNPPPKGADRWSVRGTTLHMAVDLIRFLKERMDAQYERAEAFKAELKEIRESRVVVVQTTNKPHPGIGAAIFARTIGIEDWEPESVVEDVLP